MQEIISELKMAPDVHGGFFFHRKNGILYKDMPSLYGVSGINEMGRQLTKIYAARRLNCPDVRDINLYFTGAAMMSHAIDEQFILVLLCDQSVNSSTLSVSVRLAIEEHADELTLAVAEQLSDGLTGGVQMLSPQQTLAGPLKQPLDKIQHLLVDLMGPMAELVYEESLEKWIASGRIGVDLLPEFIELIASELPDVKTAKNFKDRCRNLM
jgi:hypothetical protein